MNVKVIVKGQKRLEAKLRKVSNPKAFFDADVRATTFESRKNILTDTNKDTRRTANAWSPPIKLGLSFYKIDNDETTRDGKISIVKMLNDGRGPIRPKKAKLLYIPISKRAKEKAHGVKIKAKFKFGQDFILTKFARSFKGTKFIDKNVLKASQDLTKRMIKRIRAIF